MKTNVETLITRAKERVPSCSVAEAKTKLNDPDYVFIDVRQNSEFENDGRIQGAVNIPRGMLEFMVDKSTPYYNPVFESGKNFIFYCKSGSRSLLAAQRAQEMGLENIINMEGGFLVWEKP